MVIIGIKNKYNQRRAFALRFKTNKGEIIGKEKQPKKQDRISAVSSVVLITLSIASYISESKNGTNANDSPDKENSNA